MSMLDTNSRLIPMGLFGPFVPIPLGQLVVSSGSVGSNRLIGFNGSSG